VGGVGEDGMSQGPARAGSPSPRPWVLVLISLRFVLELALWSSFTVACVRLLGGWAGWAVGLACSAVVVALWGLLLSPRRRIAAPVGVRVVVELALFVGAGLLLAASGLPVLGAALVLVEIVVLALLQGPDKHAL
jgi:hypothetical protein